jgi:hypothetical protein
MRVGSFAQACVDAPCSSARLPRFLEEELSRRYREAAPATLALLQERCDAVSGELAAAEMRLRAAEDVGALRRWACGTAWPHKKGAPALHIGSGWPGLRLGQTRAPTWTSSSTGLRPYATRAQPRHRQIKPCACLCACRVLAGRPCGTQTRSLGRWLRCCRAALSPTRCSTASPRTRSAPRRAHRRQARRRGRVICAGLRTLPTRHPTCTGSSGAQKARWPGGGSVLTGGPPAHARRCTSPRSGRACRRAPSSRCCTTASSSAALRWSAAWRSSTWPPRPCASPPVSRRRSRRPRLVPLRIWKHTAR